MIYNYVGRYVRSVPKCVGGIMGAHARSQFWAVKTTVTTAFFISTKRKSSFSREKKNVHLEIRNLKQTDFQRLQNSRKNGLR